MAVIDCKPTIMANITIRLTEPEAAALDAIVGYGADEFLKVFYEHLGKGYLAPHESGLRSLFDSVRAGDASVQLFLRKAKEAREIFEERKTHGLQKEK